MSDGALSRRGLLTASLGVAAAPGVVACSGQARSADTAPVQRPPASSARNVRDFGAVGDGIADDTGAVARASAGGPPALLYFPAGQYVVSEWPDLPDYSVVTGDGGDVSLIVYGGEGTLIALRDRQRVSLRNIGIFVTAPDATAISLSNSFRCSFDSVVLRGNHLSDNYPQFAGQRGVVLDENTGGTAFVNSDINNFGFGLVTSCIQNYVTSSKFTSNYISVLGTGNDDNAGLALSNVEFVSDTNPRTSSQHIRVDGAANDWWLANVWFEGADVALSIGDRDRGGPAQFGMVNCKVAARSVGIDLIHCRQPYLANVQFGHDLVSPPVELKIDPVGCPEGTAVNLISSVADELDPSTFPDTWQVTGRRSTDSLVLRDPAGGYWRLAVSVDGIVEAISLGDGRAPR